MKTTLYEHAAVSGLHFRFFATPRMRAARFVQDVKPFRRGNQGRKFARYRPQAAYMACSTFLDCSWARRSRVTPELEFEEPNVPERRTTGWSVAPAQRWCEERTKRSRKYIQGAHVTVNRWAFQTSRDDDPSGVDGILEKLVPASLLLPSGMWLHL